MLVRAFFLVSILILSIAGTIAQPRFEHGWITPRAWQDVKHYRSEAPIIVLEEYEGYSAGYFYDVDGRETGFGIQTELRLVMEFRTPASLALLDTGLLILPIRSRITHFDARVLHANGQRRELNKQHCRIVTEEHPYLSSVRNRLSIREHGIQPGDQIEWILKAQDDFSIGFSESRLTVSWPTMSKELMLQVQDQFLEAYRVVTYGAFPQGTPHHLKGWQGISWRIEDLAPPDHSPFLVAERGVPRFGIEGVLKLGIADLLARYDRSHPYTRYTGRPHLHAFLEHIERRRKVLGNVSNATIFQDIVTFVHDSITMVSDQALDPNLPIGAYFRDRRMTPERLVVLYRQLANVLNERLYVGFVRDRYRRVVTSDLRAEHLNERFLAIKDPSGEGYLYITPNTLTRKYHFNELPYWINGQDAWLMHFTEEGELNKPPEQTRLPAAKPSDNALTERIQLNYDPVTRSFIGRGRASLAGQFRMAWDTNEDNSAKPDHPTLSKIADRFPLADSVLTSVTPIPRTTIHFRPSIQPDNTSTSDHEVLDLFPFIQPPTWEQSGVDVTVGCMLPFPMHVRMDIHIDLPSGFTLTNLVDTMVENRVGMAHLTLRPSPAGGYDRHFEHWIQELWLDEETFPDYKELMRFLGDRRLYTLSIRPSSPAASPASPAAQEGAPR